MLWRSRDNDWASRDPGWQMHVDAEASRLKQDIKAMNATGSLLGDTAADEMLEFWVPGIAGWLCGCAG
jgi:hypothetical protein